MIFMKWKTKLALLCAALAMGHDLPAQTDHHIIKGEKAAHFSGTDQNGLPIFSTELLKSGPVVLLFYRGNWCPYCQKQLSELQDSLQMLLETGAHVVVFTPEKSEGIQQMIGKTGATFSIVHDDKYETMKAYGLDFQLSRETVPRFYNFTLNHTRKANGNEDDILPVPATYIIGQDGLVKWLWYDRDYRNRPSVEMIMKALQEL